MASVLRHVAGLSDSRFTALPNLGWVRGIWEDDHLLMHELGDLAFDLAAYPRPHWNEVILADDQRFGKTIILENLGNCACRKCLA